MKTFLLKTSVIILSVLFSPNLGITSAQAEDILTLLREEERTGSVISITQNLTGIPVYLIIDNASGMVYISESTTMNPQIGDIVTFIVNKGKNTIIIRDIVRK